MATVFGSLFARTAAINLIRQYGETVGYYNRDGDPVRNILAIVERNELQIISETGEITGQAIVIRVRNDSTYGISSSEVDTGGDEISFPLRVGDTAQRRAIVRVINDSAGLLRVLCQ